MSAPPKIYLYSRITSQALTDQELMIACAPQYRCEHIKALLGANLQNNVGVAAMRNVILLMLFCGSANAGMYSCVDHSGKKVLRSELSKLSLQSKLQSLAQENRRHDAMPLNVFFEVKNRGYENS
jgi:hypothetical protein